MELLIDIGRGPLFRFALAVAILGLLRHVALSVAGLVAARRRAGGQRLALAPLLGRTLSRLNPLRYFVGARWAYSILSFLFHLGVIVVPVFYLGHVRLWERGLGVSWPALPRQLADGLTLLVIATGLLLVAGRAAAGASRAMSRPQDWILPPLIALEFLTGFLLAHPARNPFSLETAMFLHVWGGDLLLLVTPFTKIAHCALLPFSQIFAEMAWRMVPGAGREVTRTVGKEGQPT